MPTYQNSSLTQESIDRLNERGDALMKIAKSLVTERKKTSRNIVSKRKQTPSKTLSLKKLWSSQVEFMKLLVKERGFPQFPLDISKKDAQKFVKSVAYDCMGELHEAIQVLKNSKGHRKTEIEEFDREHFIEEIVDTQKLLLEVLILAGVSIDEFYDGFIKKTDVNKKRILNGY